MKEGAIVNACFKWLWLHNVYCWRQNTGAYKPEGSNRYIHYGTPGASDIIGLCGASGRMICVECKTAKGRLSPLQEAFKKHIEDHNGVYIVARSVDDLEANKTAILAKVYPPAWADGATSDNRVKPTGKHGAVV